jgi:hypothetical protein
VTISRMLYIDDSGSVDSGLVVYGWIECRPDRWRHALRTILEMRKALYRDHLVPPSQELHATKFVNGRSRISTRDDLEGKTEWKTLGRAVALNCLEVLASCEDIRIGAVYRRTHATGTEYRLQRAEVYQELLQALNDHHRAEDSYALIGMDGNGSDPTYYNAHRSLPLNTRHLIEDPMFHDSRQSQLMQMADLVAYTVFCHLNRHHGNQFAWEWYNDYLAPRDCQGGPQAL